MSQSHAIIPTQRTQSDPVPNPKPNPDVSTHDRAIHDTIVLERVRRVRDPSSTPGIGPSYHYEYDPTQHIDMKTRAPYEISGWHDLPVTVYDPFTRTPVNEYVNGITLIPKWTRGEYHMKKNGLNTPIEPIIAQDKKGGHKQLLYGDMLFNYGILPQTWSDPDYVFDIQLTVTTRSETGSVTQPQSIRRPGNDEPLSYVDIGTQQRDTATVQPIKVLGCLPLIDVSMNVMDFKIIGIYYLDPLAEQLNDIDDITRVLPGALPAIQSWFIHYREPDGQNANIVAGSDFMTANDAWRLINTTHNAWHKHFRKTRSTDSTHWHKSL